MNDESLQILDMVANGTISAGDAEQLLDALTQTDAPQKPKRTAQTEPPPDMARFRRYWEYPFIVGLILFALAGQIASTTSLLLVAVCGWSVVALGGLVALLGWFSQWSPWAHVRIRAHDGQRFAISVPLPLRFIGLLAGVAQQTAGRFADADTAENLSIAASFLMMAQDLSLDDPIEIEVNEEDGDLIHVFIG